MLAEGDGDGFRAVGGVELDENRVDVFLDAVFADFDWLHQTAEVYVPKSLSCDFRPEIDLRVFFATGTAHFDGLVVEEL